MSDVDEISSSHSNTGIASKFGCDGSSQHISLYTTLVHKKMLEHTYDRCIYVIH